MKHVYKSSRCDLHQYRGGSCGTAAWFTLAAIDLAIRHLLEMIVPWREACHLKKFAARKAARVFLARAGAQGLEITTRKAAEGTRAQFGACNLVKNALVQTHKRFT